MKSLALKNQLVVFYGFAFLISWASWTIMYLVYQGSEPSLVVYIFSSIGGLGPLLALAILQKLSSGEISVRQILSQIKIRQTEKRWFIPAIFAIPMCTILGNLIYYVAGQEEQFQVIHAGPDELGIFVLPVMVIHFTASLVTSPLFEEPGWRGFALGRLQKRFGRTIGSLYVGLLWWIWHQPMNLTFGLRPTFYSAVSMVVFSFIIDSLFNLSSHNLLTAMLSHQSYGTTNTFLYAGNENWISLGLKVILLVTLRLLERARQRPHLQPELSG